MTDIYSQTWLKNIITGICGLVTNDLGIKENDSSMILLIFCSSFELKLKDYRVGPGSSIISACASVLFQVSN
jgi:hypothetical protein